MTKNSGDCLIVIPARMSSTRLPGKPLKRIGDQTLIERVWRQARTTMEAKRIILATDSPEIIEEGARIGAETVLTSDRLLTGSDRVAAVVSLLREKGEEFSYIANVQGDMPFIKATIIDQAFRALKKASGDVGMVTVVTPIHDEEEFFRPSVVKAVLDENKNALYFSRAPIPYPRTKPEQSQPFGYKHIGLYVFRPETLQAMSCFTPAVSETREGLEQLRLLAHGVKIGAVIISRDEMEPQVEVDTPDDLARAEMIAQQNK